MPQKLINVGSVASDATYDSLRTIAIKLNDNLAEIYAGGTSSNFTQSGTEAVVRATQDKLRERVSVADFAGAYPDSATSSHAAFQSAMGTSGRDVYVPAGNWTIGNTVGFTGIQDVTLILAAGARIIKPATLGGKMIQFNACDRIRITSEGLAKIDSSAAPNSPAGQAYDTLYFAGGTGTGNGFEVDHIWFYAGLGYATAGGDSHVFFAGNNGNIHHNRFDAAFDLAVYLSGAGGGSTAFRNATVKDNHFTNCLNACGSKRLFQTMIYEGNTHEGGLNGVFSGEADTSNLPGVQNIIRSNKFYGMAGIPIISRISDHDIIESNILADCTGATLIGLQGTTRAKVRNNHIYINPAVYVSPSSQTAIRVENRVFNSVTYNSINNEISDNTIDGVYIGLRESDVSQNFNKYIDNVFVNGTTESVLLGGKSLISTLQTRRLQGVVTGFSGTERVETQVAVRSSGAGNLNQFTIPLSNTRACRVHVSGMASTSASASFGSSVEGTFRRFSGDVVTQVGTTTVLSLHNDYAPAAGTPSINLVADTAANAIRVQTTNVTGTMDWVLNITYTIVAINT